MFEVNRLKKCVPSQKKLSGSIHDVAMFLQQEQLTDITLWKRFVDQYRNGIDGENRGWRGEYWGKMMRGAVLVYEYTNDPKLYQILTETVEDMLTVIEPDGRVSTYARNVEFDGWDLWCRKYVLLGMEYYISICGNETLKQRIITFLCRQMDYIMAHIGKGKKCITSASRSWLGLNSSSVLEPVVRLYNLTYNHRYLDFAEYIVSCGGAEGVNVFDLAFENKIYPYQYGVNKAYEMMSCFEGLLEYALVTGSEKYLTACINFTKAIMKSDVTVIGSCGCTHELLDHSAVRQTALGPSVMQETCVTVTWMKLCSRLLQVTGERVYADAMEISFYNAYLGTLNLHHKKSAFVEHHFKKKQQAEDLVDTFLPFDSYSPLRPGKRGVVVGGLQQLPDKSYYGCCTAIGSAGVGVFAKHMIMERADGISIEFYEKGTQTLFCHGGTVSVCMDTKYPAEDSIRLLITGAKGMKVYLRIPGWCNKPKLDVPYTYCDGYMVVQEQSFFTLTLPMNVTAVLPATWREDVIWTDRSKAPAGWGSTGPKKVYHDPADDRFIAFTRGPITLCADSRTGKPADSVFSPKLPPVAEILPKSEIVPGESCLLRCELAATDGEPITLVDYASAGRDWETMIAAWLPKQC